jgi:hypothetical protein
MPATSPLRKPFIPSTHAASPSVFAMRRFLVHSMPCLPEKRCAFCNDHDPLPLLAQLQARFGDALQIKYVQREAGAIVIDFSRVA